MTNFSSLAALRRCLKLKISSLAKVKGFEQPGAV